MSEHEHEDGLAARAKQATKTPNQAPTDSQNRQPERKPRGNGRKTSKDKNDRLGQRGRRNSPRPGQAN